MSSSALPPPGNLPSWSRVSTLDRSRYPRPFLRDRLGQSGGATTIASDTNVSNVDVKFLEKVSTSAQAVCYDKNIKFLQEQHTETLKKLHQEVDSLKRENKELQFKVILSHQSPAQPVSYENEADTQNLKILVLEEQVKDLKEALQKSSSRNEEMQQALLELKSQGRHNSGEPTSESKTRMTNTQGRIPSVKAYMPLPLNASLHPLRVKISDERISRVPTLEECEFIIQQLHDVNCRQVAELSRIKGKVTNSYDASPDLSAVKTYGPMKNESFSDTRLPHLPVKPPIKKSIKSASNSETKLFLPALKNTITSTISERTRKQKAMQKRRKHFK